LDLFTITLHTITRLMQISDKYTQYEKMSREITEQLFQLDQLDQLDESLEKQYESLEKQYNSIRQKMEDEEARIRVEYWKTYRGATTKLGSANEEVEHFLKEYRSSFTGVKRDEDEKLLSILNGDELSAMSKYLLDRIKEDFEAEGGEFEELREKIVNALA